MTTSNRAHVNVEIDWYQALYALERMVDTCDIELLGPSYISRLARLIAMLQERLGVAKKCPIPPNGWECKRPSGHDGPCAAVFVGGSDSTDKDSGIVLAGMKVQLRTDIDPDCIALCPSTLGKLQESQVVYPVTSADEQGSKDDLWAV